MCTVVLSRPAYRAEDGRVSSVLSYRCTGCRVATFFLEQDRRLIFVQVWMYACLRLRNEGAYVAALVRALYCVPICEVTQVVL